MRRIRRRSRPGRSCGLTGTLDTRYGQRTLRVDGADVSSCSARPLVPAAVRRRRRVPPEPLEGRASSVAGTIVESPTSLADGLGLLVDDGTGPVRVIVGADALAGLDPADR